MTLTSIAALLQSIVLLLGAVQANPSLPLSVQQNALNSAKQTIVQAQSALSTYVASAPTQQSSNSSGSTGTTNVTGASVTSAATSVSFSVSPVSGVAPLTVYFSGSINSAGYSIDFGDGTTSADVGCGHGACSGGGPTSVGVSHTYSATGTYTPKLRRHALSTEANCSGVDCNVVGRTDINVTSGTASNSLTGLIVDCAPGYLWSGSSCLKTAAALAITADNYTGNREVPSGSSATIRWSAGNVQPGSCSVTGDGNYTGWPNTEFSPDFPTGGLSTGPIYGSHTWTLTCTALDSIKVSASVRVALPASIAY